MTGLHAARRPTGRFRGVDGLRGLAALGVVLFHFFYRGPSLYPAIGQPFGPAYFLSEGVKLFFIISGFVIFSSLERSSMATFAIKRVVRLYPGYWTALALSFITVALAPLPGREVTLTEALINLSMLQAFLGVPHVDGVYWTLGVELLFYMICALLQRGGLLRPHRLPFTLFAWLAVCVVVAHVLGTPAFGSAGFAWQAGAANLPLFMIGMSLRSWQVHGRRPWIPALVVTVIVVLGATSITAAAATALSVALLLLAIWWPELFGSRALVFLGEISYMLYLVHQNMGYVWLRFATSALGLGLDLASLTGVAGAVAVAAALTYGVEVPLRKILLRSSAPLTERALPPGAPLPQGRGRHALRQKPASQRRTTTPGRHGTSRARPQPARTPADRASIDGGL